MPRRPRLELPGVPLHVTQRGVNRAATFLEDEDFARYRQHLGLLSFAGRDDRGTHGCMA